MKIAARLSVLATVAVTGLILAATGAAVASAAPAAGHAAAVTSGTKLWEARYAASGRGAFSLASAISPDGSTLFLTGGTRRIDFANALAVSPTGNGVFVTGFIGVHDGCCNFGTVAYQP